jgi:hypothetical protein
MKKIVLSLALCAALASPVAHAAPPPAEAWQIGPVIRGKNYSVGIAGALREGSQGPWFEFPREEAGHVHYVTLPTGPLEGARQIVVRYRIDAAPGIAFVAQEDRSPGRFGLVLHREGDTWSAKDRYEAFRFYTPTTVDLSPGVHTFSARFDDPRWTGVLHSTAKNNPNGFAGMMAHTQSVSLTFGGTSGRGHGVFATGPARFTILDFRID